MARLFTSENETRIVEAIRTAETATSGEIRVHVTKRCPDDAVTAAQKVFNKLKMSETAARNGVLFFIATEDHKFAVIGDQGIDEATPEEFWRGVVDAATEKFATGDCADGLVEAITCAGEALKNYFPYQSDDKNELTDEISYA
jgi:uncharacterized membrane protein